MEGTQRLPLHGQGVCSKPSLPFCSAASPGQVARLRKVPLCSSLGTQPHAPMAMTFPVNWCPKTFLLHLPSVLAVWLPDLPPVFSEALRKPYSCPRCTFPGGTTTLHRIKENQTQEVQVLQEVQLGKSQPSQTSIFKNLDCPTELPAREAANVLLFLNKWNFPLT